MKTNRASALRNVLEAAADLLENANYRDGRAVVTVGRREYLRLRAAVRQASGVNRPVAVSGNDAFDDRWQQTDEDFSNDFCYDEGDEW